MRVGLGGDVKETYYPHNEGMGGKILGRTYIEGGDECRYQLQG